MSTGGLRFPFKFINKKALVLILLSLPLLLAYQNCGQAMQSNILSSEFNESIDVNENFDFSGPILSMASHNSGYILCGDFNQKNSAVKTPGLAMIGTDGEIDSNFQIQGSGFGENNLVSVTQAVTNGQILVGGSFYLYNDIVVGRIARLNSDGSLDTSFNFDGTGFNSPVDAIEVLSNGQILVGGGFTSYNYISVGKIVLLNSNGSLDINFNLGNTGINGAVRTIELLSNEQILVSGTFYSNNTNKGKIALLNSNGSLDTSFNFPAGSFGFSEINSIKVLSSGQILVGGFFLFGGTHIGKIVRLNPNGSLDPNFNTDEIEFSNSVSAIEALPNGQILVGSSSMGTYLSGLVRINSSGSLDTSFNSGGTGFNTGPNSGVNAIEVLSNGQILVGGNFSSYNGTYVGNNIALLNSDGSLDTSFKLWRR